MPDQPPPEQQPSVHTAPVPATAPKTRQIEVRNWKPRVTKTLRGFFSVTLPSGLVLHDLMLHEKDDSRWINMPSRPFTDAAGQQRFSPIVEFTTAETANNFITDVLAALDRHFAEEERG